MPGKDGTGPMWQTRKPGRARHFQGENVQMQQPGCMGWGQRNKKGPGWSGAKGSGGCRTNEAARTMTGAMPRRQMNRFRLTN